MKYTDGNIVGLEYTRPDTGDVVWKVLKIKRYPGTTSDLLLSRDDTPEAFLNTTKWVYEMLNKGHWTPKIKHYEIY